LITLYGFSIHFSIEELHKKLPVYPLIVSFYCHLFFVYSIKFIRFSDLSSYISLNLLISLFFFVFVHLVHIETFVHN